MSEMVERVARAIYSSDCDGETKPTPFDDLHPAYQEELLKEARAVIAEIEKTHDIVAKPIPPWKVEWP